MKSLKAEIFQVKFNQTELERRPEFQPTPGFAFDDAAPARPAAPPPAPNNLPRPPFPAVPVARQPQMREETPIRSVFDPQPLAEDSMMDESFDAEFLAGEEQSLFEVVDRSVTVEAFVRPAVI